MELYKRRNESKSCQKHQRFEKILKLKRRFIQHPNFRFEQMGNFPIQDYKELKKVQRIQVV